MKDKELGVEARSVKLIKDNLCSYSAGSSTFLPPSPAVTVLSHGHRHGQPSLLASVAKFNMRSLTNVLDEELKLYLLSMLQMQEETQHAGQMVM